MKHLALLISLIILKSCGSSQDVASAANQTDIMTTERISGTYTLEQLNTTIVTDFKLTLEFDAKTNKISGFAGCNRFFGTYTTDNNAMSISELGATRMMCQEEANNIELNMFQTLAKVNGFELSNGKLSLKNDDIVLITAHENLLSKSRQGESLNITYRASTRGFFETIWIEGNILKFTIDRNLKEISSFTLTNEQLSELVALYQNLDIKSIPLLEPPSKTHQYDAAAMATLTIKDNEDTFVSNGFDHGNPPKPIALFVGKLISIKDTITKQ